MKTDKLYVITAVSNPVRFASRWRLYEQFAKRVKDAGAQLITVEATLGDRRFHVTPGHDKDNIQIRCWDELWHKENLLNIGISRLPADWEYVAWVDADVQFIRTDWMEETIHQLQHYMVVQMWQTAIDLGPNGEAHNRFSSFAWCYNQGIPYKSKDSYYSYGSGNIYWHPGFAWAARREAIDGMGGLLDKAILGSADHHMAMSFVGMGKQSIPKGMHDSYHDYISRWQYNTEKMVRRDVGYVPGTLIHYWHGKKSNRKYWSRWDILKKWNFNPLTDLRRDWQGLYQLVDHGDLRSIGLRDDLRKYFRSRNEDSIDL